MSKRLCSRLNLAAAVVIGLTLAACGSSSRVSVSGRSALAAVVMSSSGTLSANGALQVALGATVSLSGAQSTDVGGTLTSYAWTLRSAPAGSTATLKTPGGVYASIVPDMDGTYVVNLTVTDLDGQSASKALSIVASGSLPVVSVNANIAFTGSSTTKPTQTIGVSSIISLDASASADPSGTLALSWTLLSVPTASQAVLAGTGPLMRFTADTVGEYSVRLRATNAAGAYTDVIYGFEAVNPPSAVLFDTVSTPVNEGAGSSISAQTGDLVALDGSSSTVPAGDGISEAWSLTSSPSGSTAALALTSDTSVTLLPVVPGTYVLSLVVTDTTTLARTSYQTSVVVSAAPVAVVTGSSTPVPEIAAPAFAASPFVPVALNAGNSYEVGGAALTYQWAISTRPALSVATILNAAAVQTSFVPDVAGAYVIELTATDPQGVSASQYVTVNVGTYAPVVVLSAPTSSVLVGSTASISAAASYDENADPLSFSWALTSAPAGSVATLSSADQAVIRFKPDVAGIYTFTVSVGNGSVSSVGTATLTAYSAASGTLPLSYEPLMARYNLATDKLVLVSSGPDTLHIVDPLAVTDVAVALPAPVVDMNVSPNGQYAAVLHNAVVSIVNLSTGVLVNSWPTGGAQTAVEISNAGLLYLVGEAGGQWTPGLMTMTASTGATLSTTTNPGDFYGTVHLAYADQTNTLYSISDGLSPTQIYKVSLSASTGYPTSITGSPYWGDYAMSAPLWLASDGSKVFTSAGTFFTAALAYGGSLTLPSTPGAKIVSVSDSAVYAKTVALTAVATPGGPTTYSSAYQLYQGALVYPNGSQPLPALAGAQSYGLDIFLSSSGSAVIVVQTGSPQADAIGAQYFVVVR